MKYISDAFTTSWDINKAVLCAPTVSKWSINRYENICSVSINIQKCKFTHYTINRCEVKKNPTFLINKQMWPYKNIYRYIYNTKICHFLKWNEKESFKCIDCQSIGTFININLTCWLLMKLQQPECAIFKTTKCPAFMTCAPCKQCAMSGIQNSSIQHIKSVFFSCFSY